ncbi:MAG: ferrous iron transport protein B [bacterium]|nr:ferrous iron transport protein B [bacterium]
MNLADLKTDEKGIITKVRGRGAFRKRIIEMGFIKGKEVTVIKNAPLKDPIEYKIMDYNVSLRKSEARMIDVLTPEEADIAGITKAHHGKRFRHGQKKDQNEFYRHKSETGTEKLMETASEKGKIINVALVGNPNCGKTTLFNYASGSRERVGNYSGVTIDAKEAVYKHNGYTFNIVDLPGTYSITAYTKEELYVRNHILDNAPDVVINIIDASNLERNLYLTTQLIDMDIKVVLALNIYDELEKKGDSFNFTMLGKMIGTPFVPTIASKGVGIEELFNEVIEVYEDRDKTVRHIHINYGDDIERSIHIIQKEIYAEDNSDLTDAVSSRFLAIKLLEKDKEVEEKIFESCSNNLDILLEAKNERKKLKKHLEEDSETLITDAKYGFIAGALMETLKPAKRPKRTMSERIDNFVTHNILGFPIFLAFMWLTFQLTFSLGQYPMDWIDSFMGALANFVSLHMTEGLLKDLIIDGAISGVGGVIVFLPNILIMFFMISFMEDTGYMARAAFIMDKLMHKLGLHGKSFIPLIMGFGCNVPAIMATRTLESRNDRLLTMLILPFMSCSARLPVYVLLISAFFAAHKGTMLFLIYMIGILLAVISAIIMKKTIFKTNDIPFVMELPPYRKPHLKTTLVHMWEKGAEYLKKIGGVVLAASILIWALGKFPLSTEYSKNYDGEINAIETDYHEKIAAIPATEIKLLESEKLTAIQAVELEKENERLTKSYIGRIGHFIEPVLSPMGFDWKMGVSIVTGLAAKEIVVSTMGVLFHADKEATEESQSLINNIQNQTHTSGPKKGEKVFSPLIAFTFMIFVLIYFPCIASIATIKRESGSWKWAIFSALYTTSAAWFISFLVYQVGSRIL